jgi:hypothetical protein
LCQRLLMPMAQPFLNGIGRETVLGSVAVISWLFSIHPPEARAMVPFPTNLPRRLRSHQEHPIE